MAYEDFCAVINDLDKGKNGEKEEEGGRRGSFRRSVSESQAEEECRRFRSKQS